MVTFKYFFHSPTEGAGARSKQLQGRVHLELSAGVATGLGVEAGIHIAVLIVAVVVVGPGAMEPRTMGRFGDGNDWTRGTRCRRGSSDVHHAVYDWFAEKLEFVPLSPYRGRIAFRSSGSCRWA